MDLRRNRRSRIGCCAGRFPGMGRVDRVCPWPVDCGVTVGAGLPAYGGDVHQPLGWDFDRVPRAPGAVADPLPFILPR